MVNKNTTTKTTLDRADSLSKMSGLDFEEVLSDLLQIKPVDHKDTAATKTNKKKTRNASKEKSK